MAAKQFLDVTGVVNDPSTGDEHLTVQGVHNEQAAAAGGLNIPIAAYHYNHHLGSMAS